MTTLVKAKQCLIVLCLFSGMILFIQNVFASPTEEKIKESVLPEAYSLPTADDSWVERSKLIADDATPDDNFGSAVAVSGDTIVIGAKEDDARGINSGAAYVFVRQNGVWVQQAKLAASDGAAWNEFGSSVAISGDTILIGAYKHNGGWTESGAAYVFTREGISWSQQAKLFPRNRVGFFFFGFSVAIDGNTAIVGCPGDSPRGSASGSAYVFRRDGATWSEQTRLYATDGARSDYFGGKVSVEGNTAVISAYADDDMGSASGSAYVFAHNGIAWNQQDKLIASDGAANENFGRYLSLSGNTTIISGLGNRAYVFVNNDSTWSEQAILVSNDVALSDYFGISVAISGETSVIGSYLDDDNGQNSGSTYVFTRDGTTWNQQEKLTASDGVAQDLFGSAVGIFDDTIVVGAPMNNDETGSAYIFSQGQDLSVLRVGTGGSVTSNPVGIDCGLMCSQTYEYGTLITLTATANTGSTFTDWSGDCSGSDDCIITIDEDKSVTATFTLDEHTLMVNTNGTGVGSVLSMSEGVDCGLDCGEVYIYGTVVTLTAVADTGSIFTNWSGACEGTGECVVSMDEDKNVAANFTLDKHALIVSANGNGSIISTPEGIDCGLDCSEIYDYGTVITLTAVANTGSTFTGWAGACSGIGECVVTMDNDKNVSATFTLDEHTLTVNPNGTGSGSVHSSPDGIDCGLDCSEVYAYGTVVTLTAIADVGVSFTGWHGVCSGIGACVVTMDEATNVTATFMKYVLYLPVILNEP